jgi:hypothetical protein
VQVTIPLKVAREAVNAEELRLQVNAAFIAGLPQVCHYETRLLMMADASWQGASDVREAITLCQHTAAHAAVAAV